MAPRILIVDDDLDCRTVLAELLDLSGYPTTHCGDATRALELARELLPGLALVDLHLPGRDGAWLVRALRAEEGALSRIPIVLTTGSADMREVARELDVRALEKPFDAPRLLEILRELLPANGAP